MKGGSQEGHASTSRERRRTSSRERGRSLSRDRHQRQGSPRRSHSRHHSRSRRRSYSPGEYGRVFGRGSSERCRQQERRRQQRCQPPPQSPSRRQPRPPTRSPEPGRSRSQSRSPLPGQNGGLQALKMIAKREDCGNDGIRQSHSATKEQKFVENSSSMSKAGHRKYNHNIFCNCGRKALFLKSKTNKNYGRMSYRCRNWQNKEMSCGFFKWEDESNEAVMNNALEEGKKEDIEIEKEEDKNIVKLKKQLQSYEEELARLKFICCILIALLIGVIFGKLFQ